ncbi:MAG TPA: hypothetical protein VFN68_02200 [Acidimicrobiales bacterium]|nr:hypothetical protein [Acidimicrobiales bacterium]
MAKPPSELNDDELIARVREDIKEVRAGEPLEENAPADLGDPPVDLDIDGVDRE